MAPYGGMAEGQRVLTVWKTQALQKTNALFSWRRLCFSIRICLDLLFLGF